MATNTDMSIPQARGIAPGNGTLVAAVAAATGQRPLVAGKPEAPLFHAAAKRLAADRPLVVGDRLDTDILGGNNAGFATVAVLTGVDTRESILAARTLERPDYLINDLTDLYRAYPAVEHDGGRYRSGTASAIVGGSRSASAAIPPTSIPGGPPVRPGGPPTPRPPAHWLRSSNGSITRLDDHDRATPGTGPGPRANSRLRRRPLRPTSAWPELPSQQLRRSCPAHADQSTRQQPGSGRRRCCWTASGPCRQLPVSGHGEVYAGMHDALLEALNEDVAGHAGVARRIHAAGNGDREPA